MIITIDGPAGAGKSSVARRLAQRLGFCFLDTGAMYRAVTLAALREAIDWEDVEAIGALAGRLPLTLDGDRVMIGREDVTEALRSPQITQNTRHVANNVAAREQLVKLQRRLAAGRHVVTEGRDQGTVAFPDADCKFFLTASSSCRAQRRARQLQAKGEDVSVEQVHQQQELRDREDELREVGGLRAASDARVINTDQMNLDEVVAELLRFIPTK